MYPIIDLFERSAGFHRDDPPQVKLDKLEQTLGQYQLPLEETVPLFATLLSVPVPENSYPALNLSPQEQRQRTLESVVAMWLELADRQALLFIVEDLHWIDPTTLELLGLLLDQIPTASMLTVLTGRPEFQLTWSPRSYFTSVSLTRLAHTMVEQIVERLTNGQRLPAAVLQQLVDKTDGVPLFVEEMTKAVLESGHLTIANGAYELTGPLPELGIPSTLQDVLMARLDRLVTAKGIAQMGATIGRQFSYELLRATVPVDEPVLRRELRILVEAELLYQRGVPPQSSYQFKHALIQDAAYQSLLRRTRHYGHQRIVQALETQFQETVAAHPERLAQHAFQGELWDKARTYFQRAGTQAMAGSAYREAVGCFEQALEALEHLPQERETIEQAIDMRVALRLALTALGDYEQTLAHLHTAEGLATTLDDQWRLGRVFQSLVAAYRLVGDSDRALIYSQRCHDVATTLGDVELQIGSNQRLGQTYYDLGDYHRSIEYMKDNVAVLQGERLYERFGTNIAVPAITAQTTLVLCLSEIGEFAEGMAYGDEALRLAELIDRSYERVVTYNRVGQSYLRQGNIPQALPLLEHAVAISRAAEMRNFFINAAALLVMAYAWSGRVAEASPLLEQELIQVLDQTPHRIEVVLLCGEAYLLSGCVAEASQLAQRAVVHSREHKEQGYQARALWILGEIGARHNPPRGEQAVTHYQQALTLANELGMRPLQAHCHHGLGALCHQRGQSEQARVELSTAVKMYREMEMTFWLPETEATLAKVQ